MNVRLDKYLATLHLVSRRDCPRVVKEGLIFIDGKKAEKVDMKIAE